jgi:hypothetical protein
MEKINGIVREEFKEMELGDWSQVRGGGIETVSSHWTNLGCDSNDDCDVSNPCLDTYFMGF